MMKQIIKNTFKHNYIQHKLITAEIKKYLDNILTLYPNFKNYILVIKAIINDVNFDDYTCIKCGKQFNFNIKNTTKTCSICKMRETLKSQESQNKRKKTCMERYDVEHPWKSKTIIQNIKKTNRERYGADYATQTDYIKQKQIETCKKKYGGNSPFCDSTVRAKQQQTCMQKFGVDNISKIYHKSNKFKEFRKTQTWETILTYKNYIIPLFNQAQLEKFNSGKIYKWKCVKCNYQFQQHIHKTMHVVEFPYLPRCPICYPKIVGVSRLQKQVAEFCKEYFPNLLENDRKIIKPYELDVVIPQIKLAIQFNGNYWHSIQAGIQKETHLNKVLMANSVGYRLLNIWQDQWNNNKEEIKQKLIEIFENRQNLQNCQHLDFSWYNGDTFKIVKYYQPEIKIHGQYQTFNCGYIDICFQKSLKK